MIQKPNLRQRPSKYLIFFENTNNFPSKKIRPCSEPIAEITYINEKNQKQVYESKNLHFHTESEHTFSHKKFAGELHIVFSRVSDITIDEKFCVIGILFGIKDENETYKHERDVINIFKPSTPSVYP